MIKNALLFSKHHIWIQKEKKQMVKIGISNYAQGKLGAVVFLNLPAVGEKLLAGESFGDAESIKTTSELISPIEGEVVRVNEELLDEPGSINTVPYESWLLEVKTEELPDGLMDEAAYTEYVRQQ